MPSPAPKSDLIRYALLYHHGGLYMDADFVAVKVPGMLGVILHTGYVGKFVRENISEEFNHVQQNAVECVQL